MIQPEALKTDAPLVWSTGTAASVWALFSAASAGDLPTIRSLLANDAALIRCHYCYRTPLYFAVRENQLAAAATPAEILAHLIAGGAYVDIWTAAHRGDLARVTELLDQDPSFANRNSDYNSYYLGCGSPLRNAAVHGHIEIVELLLERGADPNLAEEGIAPHGHALYSAVANQHFAVAQLLVEHGANPSAAVESFADCLSRAINNRDQNMVDLLACHGAARSVEIMAYYGDVLTAAAVLAANPALANDPGALSNAASEGQDGFVRLLLRYQPDLARLVGVGAKTGDLTEFLFQRGMDPSHSNWLGVTPLHEFAQRGDVQNATTFLDHGANPHARDEDLRSTPLAWAAKFGQSAMVELLLRRGVKREEPDDPLWATPLAWATRRGQHQIVKLLKK